MMADHAHSLRIEPLRKRLVRARVLPVVTVAGPDQAVALARALAAGGLDVVEITLRTPAALEAIRAVRAAVPAVVVGAGTVTDPEKLSVAEQAGAQFAVSPGLTPGLMKAAQTARIPFVPGVGTVSEAMMAAEAGWALLKLFPAAAIGGVAFLQALRGPLPALSFCPTGGVDATCYRDYLRLPNVLCVGGSWMVPAAALAAGDWGDITRRAQALSP